MLLPCVVRASISHNASVTTGQQAQAVAGSRTPLPSGTSLLPRTLGAVLPLQRFDLHSVLSS